jgi:transposase-like protein
LSTNEASRLSREFKLEALRRMEAGENVSVLARELGVSRKSIYEWRNQSGRRQRSTQPARSYDLDPRARVPECGQLGLSVPDVAPLSNE